MKRGLFGLVILLLPALAWAQGGVRPHIVSTLQTTDTTASSLLVGCAVGTATACTGGINAGPILGNTTITAGTSVIAPIVTTPSITTSSGALTITPAAASGVNIALSTTGDFKVNTTQLVVDTSAAKVGVNTATPAEALDVQTSTGQTGLRVGTGTNTPMITLWGSGAGGASERNWGLATNVNSQGNLEFLISTTNANAPSATKMRIDSSGQVGIAMVPAKTLDVTGTMRVTGTTDATFIASYNATTSVLAYFEQTGTSDLIVNYQRTGGTTSTWQHKLPSGSTVFSIFNASAAQASWNTSGNYGVRSLASATANTLCYDTTTISGTNTLTTCSSLRALKDEITPMSLQDARVVLGFVPVTFVDKTSRELHGGLIADDVYEAASDLGSKRNAFSTFYQGKLNGIHYDGVTAALLRVVQDQEQRLRALEGKQ